MHMRMKTLLGAVAIGVATFSFAASAAMDAGTEAALKKLMDGPQRTPDFKARDKSRHPLETLKHFGLKSDMAVMEISPAGGYWTELLAPLLKDKGRYIAANASPQKAIEEKKAKDPATYGKVELATFGMAADAPPPVPAGSLDMVLTFRNLHNWMMQGAEKQMLTMMLTALKPGGYLGIKDHRGDATKEQNPKGSTGYVREDYAIKLIEEVGFKLVSKSEANANPKDTKDYPGGVWTLPPNLRGATTDADKAKFQAISESDRFTLLFQKPVK